MSFKTEFNIRHAAEDVLNESVRYGLVIANIDVLAAAAPNAASKEELRRVMPSIKHRLATNSDYAEAFKKFFEKYPSLDMDGNRRLLESHFEVPGESAKPISFGRLDLHYQLNSGAFQKNQAAQDAETQRVQNERQWKSEVNEQFNLVAEVMDGYYTTDDYGNKVLKKTIQKDDFDRREEELFAMPISELRSTAERVRYNRQMKGRSVEDLRADLKTQHRQKLDAQRVDSRYPILPKIYTFPGEIKARELNRELLTYLANNDVEYFRKFLRVYGNEQITARMQEPRGE